MKMRLKYILKILLKYSNTCVNDKDKTERKEIENRIWDFLVYVFALFLEFVLMSVLINRN